jgi:hypothetical protein
MRTKQNNTFYILTKSIITTLINRINQSPSSMTFEHLFFQQRPFIPKLLGASLLRACLSTAVVSL